jgi:hypothetical protein
VSAKRYRYTGTERDEETALYYCGSALLRGDKAVIHITEGHHRMAAAQELFEETGDPSFVQQLPKHANIRRGAPPPSSARFPRR